MIRLNANTVIKEERQMHETYSNFLKIKDLKLLKRQDQPILHYPQLVQLCV